jgi:hypothetical protein
MTTPEHFNHLRNLFDLYERTTEDKETYARLIELHIEFIKIAGAEIHLNKIAGAEIHLKDKSQTK